MPDYQELYLTLMRETEKAIRILTEAQQACEELYLSNSDHLSLLIWNDEQRKEEEKP